MIPARLAKCSRFLSPARASASLKDLLIDHRGHEPKPERNARRSARRPGGLDYAAVRSSQSLQHARSEAPYLLAHKKRTDLLIEPPCVGCYSSGVQSAKLISENSQSELNPNSEVEWGARPPRASFSAPSRKTSAAPKSPNVPLPSRALGGGTRGASRNTRGRVCSPTSKFGLDLE